MNMEEAKEAKVGNEKYAPTQEEINRHMATHLPYRSWCEHCVKGKGLGMPHKRNRGYRENGEPVVSVDYTFMHDRRNEEEGRGMPIMVV